MEKFTPSRGLQSALGPKGFGCCGVKHWVMLSRSRGRQSPGRPVLCTFVLVRSTVPLAWGHFGLHIPPWGPALFVYGLVPSWPRC